MPTSFLLLMQCPYRAVTGTLDGSRFLYSVIGVWVSLHCERPMPCKGITEAPAFVVQTRIERFSDFSVNHMRPDENVFNPVPCSI